ncbi:MAG: hypothetical protein DMG46_04245 [Acidobacteria bacterium]|nr:MAG: hypothetical protein DMG46_04245 [Acidobacteriota bacterium]
MVELALERHVFAQRGKRLEYFTIAWNSLEGIVAVVAGVIAGSISLVGFGVDSFIEVISGTALLWRMSVDAEEHHRERIEQTALRIEGACFLALAAYVSYEAVSNLMERRAPEHAAMNADAKQTEFCTYLSAILLGGLLLNAVSDLWWADPAAALVMVPVIGKEGVDGLRGNTCCE